MEKKMFDFHLHSSLSFDSKCPAQNMVAAAERLGLREICFTDHFDFSDDKDGVRDIFTPEEYGAVYGALTSDKVTIRRGVEFGITTWNQKELADFLGATELDFVIGSVHYAGGTDPYYPEYWKDINIDEAFEKYLLKTLECVKVQNNYDVLGHINYVCKSPHNPTHQYLRYTDYSDICDEIMKTVAENGKGMEINTSGVDRVGDFLPSRDFIKRFRELGGEIVTVGSDSHDDKRIGQYVDGAIEIAKDVFGYVCTFKNRRPVFHKI